MDAYGDKYPSRLLTEAVDAIGSLPGVGRRSALRFALHLLKQPSENVHHFTQALNNHSRDHRQVCVVENVRDVMSIEATGQYHGVYHVLGGIISPINGIGPSDLTVDALVERIEALSSGDEAGKVEVILALSGDVEGETTSFYIYRRIASFGVRVSSLARGLGFGDDIEYADALTLGRSIAGRVPFKP